MYEEILARLYVATGQQQEDTFVFPNASCLFANQFRKEGFENEPILRNVKSFQTALDRAGYKRDSNHRMPNTQRWVKNLPVQVEVKIVRDSSNRKKRRI